MPRADTLSGHIDYLLPRVQRLSTSGISPEEWEFGGRVCEGVSRQRRREGGKVLALIPRQEGAVADVAVDAVLPDGAGAVFHLLALGIGAQTHR